MPSQDKDYLPEGRKIRILIADDHSVVVEGVKSIIAEQPRFEVVGTATNGLEAVEKTKTLKPDAVIMDVSMPHMNGIDAACRIKQINPNVRILVFSMFADKEYIVSLFRAGVSGYLLKDEPLSDIILAMESVMGGATYFSSQVLKIIRNYMERLETGDVGKIIGTKDPLSRLSNREKEVFPLLADGKSVREIADRLCISPKTVETHKYNIMEKLGIKSIAEMTKIAIRKNLIRV